MGIVHVMEKRDLVGPIVFLMEFGYNFERLIAFGLTRKREKGICFTHRYLLGVG